MSKIIFTGTGGTGKTSCAKALQQKHPNFLYITSIVRKIYEEKGITTVQAAFDLTPKQQFEFQKFVLKRYVENALQYLQGDMDIIMERSVYCHIAYCINSYPDASFDELCELYDIAEPVLDLMDKIDVYLFYFPYPTSFTQNESDQQDGFRPISAGSHTILDALMFRLAEKYQLTFPITIMPDTSIENRIEFIEEQYVGTP